MPLLPASEGGSCIDLAEGPTDTQIKADEYAEPQGRFGVDLAARRFMLHVRMYKCTHLRTALSNAQVGGRSVRPCYC